MRVRKVSSNDVKLYDLTKVKWQTVGIHQVVQFTAGITNPAQFVIFPKMSILIKRLARLNQRRNLRIDTSLQRVSVKVLISRKNACNDRQRKPSCNHP